MTQHELVKCPHCESTSIFIHQEDDLCLCGECGEVWERAAKAQDVPDASTSISKPMPSGYMLNTLIKFQKWRIGEDERTLDEAGLTPRSITLAIDWAIEQLVDILLAVNDEDSYCD